MLHTHTTLTLHIVINTHYIYSTHTILNTHNTLNTHYTHTLYSTHTILNTHYTQHTLYSTHTILNTHYTQHTLYSTHTILNTHYTQHTLYSTYTTYTQHTLYSTHTILNTHYTQHTIYSTHTIHTHYTQHTLYSCIHCTPAHTQVTLTLMPSPHTCPTHLATKVPCSEGDLSDIIVDPSCSSVDPVTKGNPHGGQGSPLVIWPQPLDEDVPLLTPLSLLHQLPQQGRLTHVLPPNQHQLESMVGLSSVGMGEGALNTSRSSACKHCV